MARIEPFENAPDRYERWFDTHPYVYRSELAAVRGMLPKGGRGVEVGVGSGRFAASLGIGMGVEPSERMTALAVRREIDVVRGIAEHLPFGDAGLDLILMVTTICFLDDVEQAFRESYRVLRPQGSIVLGFVDAESPLGRRYQQNRRTNVFYADADFYSTESLVSRLRRVGFHDFSFSQTIFRSLETMEGMEPATAGHGKGSFVVIRGER